MAEPGVADSRLRSPGAAEDADMLHERSSRAVTRQAEKQNGGRSGQDAQREEQQQPSSCHKYEQSLPVVAAFFLSTVYRSSELKWVGEAIQATGLNFQGQQIGVFQLKALKGEPALSGQITGSRTRQYVAREVLVQVTVSPETHKKTEYKFVMQDGTGQPKECASGAIKLVLKTLPHEKQKVLKKAKEQPSGARAWLENECRTKRKYGIRDPSRKQYPNVYSLLQAMTV
ncbi:hypothetical protein SELMODRAFT_413034 [Selaginella moellendorffii]|uniref:Uncharacterized protein n=1 Tax=Selaginella moellendorffii TaxID=88036 RepID=D8RN48_SELML|nr:hypothetical protein SELMODRAFT_413034 [Selaginella moellendorffii]